MTDESKLTTLKAWGPTRTRLMLQSGQIYPSLAADAAAWIAQIEEEERLRSEASQAEQYRTARTAKNAAIVAAIAAIITIPLAIIGIIISILAWVHPYSSSEPVAPPPVHRAA